LCNIASLIPFLTLRIDQIKRALFGIYALSNAENADVFLEIGSALAMGKKVYLLCKKGSSLPEAIKSFDCIEYEDFPSLTEKIRKRINL